MKAPKEEFAISNIEITPDLLDEIKSFFVVFPEKTFKYGILQIKVNEIDESTKEIILEGRKNTISKTINVNNQYSEEEVIFYTYVLLHAEYEWFSNKKGSNLNSFCHNFFTKADKFTEKGKERDAFVNLRMFEMCLFCSIKNNVDYNLPPFEELWRVFLGKENLLPSSYSLLFNNEKNTVRKLRVSEKAFEETKDERYLTYILTRYFYCEEYLLFIEKYIANRKIIEEETGFPYHSILYFYFIECCLKLNKIKELNENIREGTSNFLSGHYTKDFVLGVVSYKQKDFEKAEKYFLEAIISGVNADSEETRNANIFYISSLLKQNKNEKLLPNLSDIVPSISLLSERDTFDFFGYKQLEAETLKELKEVTKTEDVKAMITYSEIILNFSSDDLRSSKEKTSKLLNELKNISRYYNGEFGFHYLYSEIFFLVGDFNNSYRHKVLAYKNIKPVEQDITFSIDFNKVKEDFYENIIELIKNSYPYRTEQRNIFESVILSEIVDHWWSDKDYTSISILSDYLDENEALSTDFLENYYFEIAYSFVETGKTKKAKKYYELYLPTTGKNSAVLNNLSNIYEEEGNLSKAKDLIKKAFELTDGKDEIINRNKARLFNDGKKKEPIQNESKLRNSPKIEERIIYDAEIGELIFGQKKKKVRMSKIMPLLLKALFEKPTKVRKVTDVLEDAGLDDTMNNQAIRDGVKQICEKLLSIGVKDKVFSYTNERIVTLDTYLDRIGVK